MNKNDITYYVKTWLVGISVPYIQGRRDKLYTTSEPTAEANWNRPAVLLACGVVVIASALNTGDRSYSQPCFHIVCYILFLYVHSLCYFHNKSLYWSYVKIWLIHLVWIFNSLLFHCIWNLLITRNLLGCWIFPPLGVQACNKSVRFRRGSFSFLRKPAMMQQKRDR